MAIEWRPIAEIPDDRKDGRDILLWDESGAAVASWSDGGWDSSFASEIDGDPIIISGVSHWADINRPGDGPMPATDDVEDLARQLGVRLK